MSATAVQIPTTPVTFPMSVMERMDTVTIQAAAEMKWSSDWSAPAGTEGRKVTTGKRERIPKVLLSVERNPKFSAPKGAERRLSVKESLETLEKINAARDRQAADQAWGPVFQSREHFTEMHFC